MHAPRDRDFRGNFILSDRHGRIGSQFDPRDYPSNNEQPQHHHHTQQQQSLQSSSSVRSISHPPQRDRGATPLSTASSSDLDAVTLLPPRKKHRVPHGGGGGGFGKRKLSGCQLTAIWLSVIFLLFCGFLGLGLYLHGEHHLHIPVFDSIGKYLLTTDSSFDSSGVAGSSASVCSHDNIVREVTKDPRLRKTTRRQATGQLPKSVCVTPR